MMDYNMMSGTNGSNMMFFAWLAYSLLVALSVLAIVALVKYIKK
ncbi:MAG: hypothetical protein Q8P54_02020 [bacterium]|nr:hypothetical protein [bacterium]